MWNSPSSSPWHELRSENWQVFLQGRLRLGFSRKRLNTIKAASPSDLPRTQASVFSSNSSWIPLEQPQRHWSATTIFMVTALQPVSYKGLVEYCWMSCLWQGLQTHSGLILDGRGSSFAEQASQKTPPQFLQIFWNRKRREKFRDAKDTWAFSH